MYNVIRRVSFIVLLLAISISFLGLGGCTKAARTRLIVVEYGKPLFKVDTSR